MTTILTLTTRHTPSSTAVRRVSHKQDFTVCLLLSSVWSWLNSSVLFLHRRLQPVVQPHHGPPRTQDAHVQAASQKPLQQRQRQRSSGAFAFPCASSSSAHAFHPAAEGQRQRARQRLCWRVRTAVTQCDCCWKTFRPVMTNLFHLCQLDLHYMSTIWNNFFVSKQFMYLVLFPSFSFWQLWSATQRFNLTLCRLCNLSHSAEMQHPT